jgi:hypothetical protein
MTASAPNGILLCFQTSDQAELTKACEYWAIGDDSKWLYSVKSLSDRHATNSTLLLKDVKQAASAYDLSDRCDWCKTPSIASKRSDMGRFQSFTSRRGQSQLVNLCPQCDKRWVELGLIQQEKQRQKDRVESVALIVKLNEQNSNASSEALTLVDAVYLYATLQTSDISESGFEDSQSFSLKGNVSGSELVDKKIIEHLYKKGLIKISVLTSMDSINGENKKKPVDYIKAKWEISDRFNGCSYFDLMMELSEIINDLEPSQEEISSLWKVVALAECQRKLLEVAALYTFKNFSIGDKTNSAIMYILQDFSIPRAWSIIQSALKTLAARVQSGRIKSYLVITCVPNELEKFADRSIEESWNTYPLSRQNWDTEPVLTSLFFNRVLRGSKEHFRTLTTKMINGKF